MALVSGDTRWISCIASRPFNKGIARSSTAMPGWRLLASLQASCPSEASPTTSCPDFSSSARTPWRMIWWSSASNTREPISPPQRNFGPQGRTAAGLRGDVHRTAERAEALANADQSEPCAALEPVRGETDAVIAHGTRYALGGLAKLDVRRARAGVLDHVVERFLRDPIERDLHGGRQASGELAAHRDGHPGTPADVLGKKLQRRHEPEPIEHHRPQLVGEVAQLRFDLAQEPLHLVETLAMTRRQFVRDVGDRHVHRGEQLSGLVVQRVGDLLYLVFQRLVQLPPHARVADRLLLLADDALSLLHETDGYGVGDPVCRRLVSVQDPVEQLEVRSIPGEERAREHVAQQQHDAHDLVGLDP